MRGKGSIARPNMVIFLVSSPFRPSLRRLLCSLSMSRSGFGRAFFWGGASACACSLYHRIDVDLFLSPVLALGYGVMRGTSPCFRSIHETERCNNKLRIWGLLFGKHTASTPSEEQFYKVRRAGRGRAEPTSLMDALIARPSRQSYG